MHSNLPLITSHSPLMKPPSPLLAGTCLEYMLPAKADLLLLEHLPYLEGSEPVLGMERLLHRLQLHFNSTLPPVVFLNMHRALHQGIPTYDADDRCIRNIKLCPSECPSSFKALPEPDSVSSEAEMRTHALARWVDRLADCRWVSGTC